MTIKKLIFILAVLLNFCATAQDVHFSQQFYSPLTLNPALTGATSPIQAIVNYRQQWNSVGEPFNTIGASFDARLNNKNTKKGIFAIGVNFYNDNSGVSKVKTNNVNLHFAYHLPINQTNMIGIGIYGGWGQQTLDLRDEQWGVQYDATMTEGYNPNMASGETFGFPSFSYMDAGTGLVYTYDGSAYRTAKGETKVQAGAAVYHVSQPDYSFVSSTNDVLHMRISAFANAVFGIKNTKNAFMPSVYFNTQNSSREILLGTYYRYTLTEGSQITGYNKPFYISAGLFTRFNDAMIAKLLLQYQDYSVGFAYDFNISNLSSYSKSLGGFELFLRYNLYEMGGGTFSKIR